MGEVVALNLIVLILNALHGLLSFYGKDYTMLNLDGLFGLRIIEGQLKHLYAGHYDNIPVEIMTELRSISQNASKIANMALPHVYEDDPDYFKKFKYLVNQPWSMFKAHRLLDPGGVWRTKSDYGCVSETESDECISELMEAVSSVAEDLAKDEREHVFGCNLITRPCLERMVKKKGCSGYSLAHQLLYVAMAELVGCVAVVDEFARSISYEDGVNDVANEFCANLHRELMEMVSRSRPASKRLKGRYFPQGSRWTTGQAAFAAGASNQDLFLEMQFVCGQLGFMEFAQREWLEAALNWQLPTGCYSNKDEDESEDKPIPRRQLLVEKELEDDCASHKSAVAAGALTTYLRFLIDPGPVEFRHLRIDTQPSTIDSIPLAGRFWKPPTRWAYRRIEKQPLPSVPYPARFRDTTFFWFLFIAICFFYVTYRLCRRPNVRYMRFRGLKWR